MDGTLNRCKTCRWWKWDASKTELTYNPNDAPDSKWQERTPTSAIPIQHECGNEHVSSRDPSGMVDSEDYGGVFTGPDFGCIHHEETQEQLPQGHPGYADQLIKRELGPGALRPAMNFESISGQIKRGVISRRPDGSICEA